MSALRVVASTAQPAPGVGLRSDAPIPVARLIRRLDKRIREKLMLQGYWLTGEVLDLRRGGRGALYFELRDHGSRVACVMAESFASRATDLLANGRRAVVFATVDLDDRDGRVRLAVTDVQDHGEGAEQRKLACLREALRREGLFEAERKQRVPVYPTAVALITSESAAARHDFVSVAKRRHPGVPIVLIPAAMQGQAAVPTIIAALRRASRTSCDVVVVARGGGTELASVFNDAAVVRAVAMCRLPVVTAIGHETDRFLVDDAADLSVATPSAAAEQTIPERAVLLAALVSRTSVVRHGIVSQLRRSRAQLDGLRDRLAFVAQSRVADQRAGLTTRHDRLCRHAITRCHRDRRMLDQRLHAWEHGLTRRLQRERARLDRLGAAVNALNPQAVMARGFAFLTDAQGQVASSIADVRGAGQLTLRMHDGEVRVVVCEPDHPSL